MAKFKVGDLVQLNSGSPDLSVTHTYKETVGVVWTDKDGGIQRFEFPEVCLKPAEKEIPQPN
jgi:uncharacterized protein YodC (DUF2158 family)